MIKRLHHFGSEYGGYWLAPDMIPREGVVIDAGIGTDISFADHLAAFNGALRFVGIDTSQESLDYARRVNRDLHSTLILGAISSLPEGDPLAVWESSGSESVFVDHRASLGNTRPVPAVNLARLIATHAPCIVKLDIEGSEYKVYRDTFGVPQVAIEFHHGIVARFTEDDTRRAVADFFAAGYTVAHSWDGRCYLFVKEGK